MNKVTIFDQALKYHNITKKEFAQKSNIPYDTVAGWKRNGSVPNFAFALFLRNVVKMYRNGRVFSLKTPSNKIWHKSNTKNQNPNLSVQFKCYDNLIFCCSCLVLTVFSGKTPYRCPSNTHKEL